MSDYTPGDVINCLSASYELGAPKLVMCARTFIGVPFVHRGRSRKGVDCAGLVWCAYSELGVKHPDIHRYGREPHKNGMMRAVVDALGAPIWAGAKVRREMIEIGDVLVMRFEVEPHHMGIVGTDRHYGLSLIHANGRIEKAQGGPRVVEHGLDALWQSRVCAVFRRAV